MKIFAERLKDLRNDKGLSIRDLAKNIEVSSIAVSRWERSERIPSIESLYKLAVFFDISSDYLIGLED